MKTEIIGPENVEPEYSIVYCIHGDETCGKKAVEKLKASDYELNKPVKLVFANEEAYEENVRYIDTDLNRIFPGDPQSELLEEKLAVRIYEEVEDTTNLVIHSTHSQPTPFSIMSTNQFDKCLVEASSTKWIGVYKETQGSLECLTDSVVVEAGPQGTSQATKEAYNCLLNFLSEYEIIDREKEIIEPEYFQIKDQVKQTGYEFLGENFEKVNTGEVFAKKGKKTLTAETGFYPFLMSTNGYNNMLGFRAEKIRAPEKSRKNIDSQVK